MGVLRLTSGDLVWLKDYFPNLWYDQEANAIVGELDFCAFYDEQGGQVHIDRPESRSRLCLSNSYLCDVFEVKIDLNSALRSENGWPKVYEVGGRKKAIATKYNVSLADLHFFPDESCCLGIRYTPDRHFSIERLLHELLIPFFYRLSYVNHYGLESARRDLWGEYSHDQQGHTEYQQKMISLAQKSRGRNKLCPCGSRVKYKRCCLPEAEAAAIRFRRQNTGIHS